MPSGPDARFAQDGGEEYLTEQVNVKLAPADYDRLEEAVDASPHDTAGEYARAVLRSVTDPDEDLPEVLCP